MILHYYSVNQYYQGIDKADEQNYKLVRLLLKKGCFISTEKFLDFVKIICKEFPIRYFNVVETNKIQGIEGEGLN